MALALVAALQAFVAPSGAGGPRTAVAAPPPTALERRLQPGDQLRIDVLGRADASGTYTVGPTGTLQLPLVGSVFATGRTASEMADVLTREFSRADRDVQRVTVSLMEALRVYVLGGVLRPGVYTFQTPPTVWEAIAEAGGGALAADLKRVRVVPAQPTPDHPVGTVDITAALAAGTVDQIERLRAGDTVRVPLTGEPLVDSSEAQMVQVFGAVLLQGPRAAAQSPDLISAIVMSGGVAPDANLNRIAITRRVDGRVLTMRVSLKNYLDEGTPSGNPPLMPGDAVYVPVSRSRLSSVFTILGILSPLVAIASGITVLSRH